MVFLCQLRSLPGLCALARPPGLASGRGGADQRWQLCVCLLPGWPLASLETVTQSSRQEMHRARAAAVALSLVPTGTRSLDVRLSVRSRSSSPAPDAGRPTHFVSLRLGDPLLHLAVKRAQELIVAREPRARGCEVPPEKSHLTAFVMRLDSDAAVDQAKQALRSCTCLRAQGVPPPRILLSGLGSFRQDVIFVQAVPSAGLERARVVVQVCHCSSNRRCLTRSACHGCCLCDRVCRARGASSKSMGSRPAAVPGRRTSRCSKPRAFRSGALGARAGHHPSCHRQHTLSCRTTSSLGSMASRFSSCAPCRASARQDTTRSLRPHRSTAWRNSVYVR